MNADTTQPKSAIALIDGEHYLPVTKSALDKISEDYELKAAVFIGGTEKIADDKDLAQLGVNVIKEEPVEPAFIKALEDLKPDIVVDLSDEPVLDYRRRFKLASITLHRNISYIGADFYFQPPHLHKILNKPSLGIIGTGKRVGKTAISAYVSRLYKQRLSPVIIAMGRGGPEEPEVLEGDKIELTPQVLLEQSKMGKHAASDYYEDALMSRVRTIGCRRAGGGLAGEPFVSNVLEGAKIANKLDNDLVILEGSGATIPPIKADKNILVIGAYQNTEDVAGYFGPYRLMSADLIILTMSEEPQASPEKIKEMEEAIRTIRPDIEIIRTVLRPKPLSDVSGKRIFIATTAKNGLENIKGHIESVYKGNVVAISNELSNRPLLKKAIAESPDFDVLITELKAAAVDVATSVALDLKKEVVYMDNDPMTVDGKDLEQVLWKICPALD